VIQTTGGIVVARGVAGGDVVGQVQVAGDLIQNLSFELPIRRGRLLGLDLAQLPAIRKDGGHAFFQLDHIHRLDRGRLAIGRGIGK